MKTTEMNIEKKLEEMGLVLPPAPAAAGNYLPFVKTGNLLYISGALPVENGAISHTGKVGEQQSIDTGYKAAQICALNTLTIVKQALGSFEKVKRLVFLGGYVNGVEGFPDSPAVINGASDLFVELFGESGKHARAAVAVAGLPKDSSVEIQCVFEC